MTSVIRRGSGASPKADLRTYTFATAASGSGLSNRYVPFVSLTCSSVTTTRFIAASSTVASVPPKRSVPGPGTLRWPSVPIPCALGDSRGSALVRPTLLRRCWPTDAVLQAGPDRDDACVRVNRPSRACDGSIARRMAPHNAARPVALASCPSASAFAVERVGRGPSQEHVSLNARLPVRPASIVPGHGGHEDDGDRHRYPQGDAGGVRGRRTRPGDRRGDVRQRSGRPRRVHRLGPLDRVRGDDRHRGLILLRGPSRVGGPPRRA